jgi:hypothetical protein
MAFQEMGTVLLSCRYGEKSAPYVFSNLIYGTDQQNKSYNTSEAGSAMALP